MIITNANSGEKAKFSLKGKVLMIEDVTIDLQDKQKGVEAVIDICLDNQLKTMREGMGAWYVANIIIPAKEFEYRLSEEVDESGEEQMKSFEKPLNPSQVILNLWALPTRYFEVETEKIGDEA